MKKIFALLVLCIIAFSSNAWAWGENDWKPSEFGQSNSGSCPSGQEWSVVQQKCVGKSSEPQKTNPSNQKSTSVPTCPDGYKLNYNMTGCVADSKEAKDKEAQEQAKEVLEKYSVQNTAPEPFKPGQIAGQGVEDTKTTESTPTGKPTSGNVEKPSFVGSSNLSSEYYGSDKCGGGNIFQQLACRAGTIGSGLKTAGYMIAGFGLIVFAFAAIFGKVKWPLFATIAFSCFLLSITMAVINMMTKDGEQWMGDVSGAGSISTSATDQPKGNTDANEVSKDKS